jgi:hypothetical protein
MQVRPANSLSCWVQAIILLAATLSPSGALCQQPTPHQQILQLVDQRAARFSATSRTIWEYAEVGYQEEKSSALLQRELQAAGFRVQAPVADEPTGGAVVVQKRSIERPPLHHAKRTEASKSRPH